MQFDSIKGIAYEARSIRSFDESYRIPDDVFEYLVTCADFCPSAGNLQPLKYRIVSDEDECSDVFANTKWAAYLKDIQLPPEGHRPVGYIVICHDTAVSAVTKYSSMDAGIAAQTINLAAKEKGLGCCMIGSFDPEQIGNVLRLPRKCEPVLVLALGKPDETPIICKPDDKLEGNERIKYFRDKAGLHFVPKRSLDEIILK